MTSVHLCENLRTMSSVPQPPGERASRSGCLIALYVMLGLGAFVLVAGAIAVWLFLRSETGQRLTETVSSGIALTREATTAPGTAELRAAGCSQAMVIPTARMLELFGQELPEADPDADTFNEATVVLCQRATDDAGAPDCADVARIYGDAVPDAPPRFGVVVQGAGRGDAVCEGAYGPDGTLLDQ